MTRCAIALFSVMVFTDCTEASDGWSARDRQIVASLRLEAAGPVPPSPSNRFADSPQAAELGRKLFFDTRLSGSGKIACATCHQPPRHFADGRATAVGAGPGRRNTPTVIGAAYQRWFYWDGRRDSLWSQALIPFEAPDEMGSSRVQMIRIVLRTPAYRRLYEAVFGVPPVDAWLRRLPAHAGPFGAPATRDAWHRMAPAVRDRVNRIYANLGKAIAAYERTLTPAPSPFDRYADGLVAGSEAALTPAQRRGLALFIDDRTRCLRCHNGPMLSNGGFHNIGTGNLQGEHLDFGRLFGLQAVTRDEFNCLGRYSDAAPDACTALRFINRGDHHLQGAFKVPSLRAVSKTAPYFHDGRFATLREVVEFYNAPEARIDGIELDPIHLSATEVDDLVAFLEIL